MAKFKVAMVDYDYGSITTIQTEVEHLGGAFVHRRCKDVKEAITWAGDAISYLAFDRQSR